MIKIQVQDPVVEVESVILVKIQGKRQEDSQDQDQEVLVLIEKSKGNFIENRDLRL